MHDLFQYDAPILSLATIMVGHGSSGQKRARRLRLFVLVVEVRHSPLTMGISKFA